jgi:hypothetical protein
MIALLYDSRLSVISRIFSQAVDPISPPSRSVKFASYRADISLQRLQLNKPPRNMVFSGVEPGQRLSVGLTRRVSYSRCISLTLIASYLDKLDRSWWRWWVLPPRPELVLNSFIDNNVFIAINSLKVKRF